MEQDRHPSADAQIEALRQKQAERRRQRKRKRLASALLTVLAIALLTGFIILVLEQGSGMLSGLLDDRPAPAADPQTTDSEKYSTVTIAAVGDISISDAQLVDARTADGYDFSPCFFGAAELIGGADLAVANLECNLAGAPYGTATSSAPNALAETLAGTGFDLLQTANSAAILNGMDGLRATIAGVEHAGMDPVGTFATAQSRRASGPVTVREVHGVRVAFVAFTKGLGNMSLPEDSSYAVNLLYSDYDSNYRNLDLDGIEAIMAEARRRSPDLIIALVHWGSENSRNVSDSQRRVVRALYEGGANAIIGTHSHLIGPIEAETIAQGDAAGRDVLTAYDLGNFYTESTKPGTRTSLLLRMTFTRNNWTGKTTLTDWSYTPLYCADLGPTARDRFQVLDIQNAITLYEQDYLYRVSDELYDTLTQELATVENYVNPEAE